MSAKRARLWIGVLVAAGILYAVAGVSWKKSPGPVAAVHERAEDLDGGESCSGCHGGWFESMTEACLECHTDVAAHVESGRGLHGAIGKEKVQTCALCHSDHNGWDFAMVNRRSFAEAGTDGPESFDHAFVGFDMNGAHLEVACTKCHTHAEEEILPEGARRFLGLDKDCGSCHEDAHEGRMALHCAKCHGQTTWDGLHSVGHEEHLPLVGGHGDVACRECHADGGPHSLEALGRGRPLAQRTCRQCHDSPHRESFVEGVAAQVTMAPGASCVVCHAAEHTSFRDERATTTPEQHGASGFPLVAPHAEVACKQCHRPQEQPFDLRYPGRTPEDCAKCHEDPHAGQFGSQMCVSCHAATHFEPHAYTTEMHESTAFPLTGRHLETACRDCHIVPERESVRTFVGTPAACDGCHKDAHLGFFTARTRKAEDCALCHLTTDFSSVPEERFDHGEWTDFPVRGAHAQEECESCHTRTNRPDQFERTFGRVSDLYGKYKGCVTCHLNPHGAEFDLADKPQEVRGRRGCARCHVETSFRAFPDGFDHGTWTGFPLDGVHKEIECSQCHAPLEKPDESGRTWGRAQGKFCADCHRDPHAGQFRVKGVTSCERCHRSAMTFSDLVFRHNFDSRFRLGEAHENLACSACHKEERIGAETVVRYRPLGAKCSDCHDVQDNPFRRRKR